MDNADYLCIISWNAAGLSQHYPELLNFLDSSSAKPLAICIQESHLYSYHIPTIRGYTIFDNPRITSNGGGTTIYVNNNYIFSCTSAFINNMDSCIEGNSVTVTLASLEIVISNLYLPPNCTVNKSMLENIKVHENHLLLGDFNAKNVLWGSPSTDSRGRFVEEFLNNNHLVCLNDGSGTHLNHDGSVSHLDLALGKGRIPDLADFLVLNDSWGSDHFPVIITLLCAGTTSACINKGFNFRKADWNLYQSLITESLDKELFLPAGNNDLTQSVADKYQRLASYMELAKGKAVPRVGKKQTKYAPFWNDDCHKAIINRRKAEKRMQKHKTEQNILKYRQCKAKVKYVIKLSKQRYWGKFAEQLNRNSNLSYIWNLIKSINGKLNNNSNPYKSLVTGQTKNNNDIVNNFSVTFKEISANENIPEGSFNSRKATISSEINTLYNTTPNNITDDVNALNSPFNIYELKDVLDSCKLKTSAGPDRIPYQLITMLSEAGLIFFLDMINQSWRTGEIPEVWRSSYVKPILKTKRDASEYASYRPITLSNTVPKIVERLVARRLNWFLVKNKLINQNQTGFLRGHQSIDQVYRLTKEAGCAIECGSMTVAILIDFSCAFDLVWTDAIIIKLIKLHIKGFMLKWIKMFLADRLYRVKINEDISDPYSLDNGTPQGSSLSPLLFLIMVNDFPVLSSHTSAGLFADDSTIWRSGTNISIITHHLQLDIDTVCNWCSKWGLKINTKKTAGIVFTHKTKIDLPDIKINNEKITFVDNVKMLGITLDKRLTWKSHIKTIIDSCAQCLNIVRLLSGSTFGSSKRALLSVYRGLIRSRIDYGCFLYQDSSITNLKLLDSLQYKALLLCTGGMKGTPCSNLLIECGETSLAQRRFEFYMKFLTRMKFSNVSPCRNIFQDTIICSLTRKFRSNEGIIFSNVLSECNVNIANLTLSESLNPPWSLPLVNVDISLHQVLSKSTDIVSKFDNTNKFVTEHYTEHIQVFVDGSKTLNNQCGISLVVPSLDINFAVGVDSTASPLTVEMLAILNAVRFIESSNISKAVIFSDCLTAVSNVKIKANSTFKQHNPSLCKTIQNYLEHQVGKVSLCWFPAHIGDVYQELADFCSKHPSTMHNTGTKTYKLNCIDGESFIEEHDIIHNLILHFKERWRRLWLNNKPSMEYSTLLGFSETQLSVRLNRHEEKILNRLRLCTCGLKAYLFKIGIEDSNLCEDCGVPETVEHFILYCTKHQDLHKHLMDLVKGLLLPFDVRSVLNNNITIKYVVSYILNNNLKI